jgi:uncharacterized membrane protein YcaP (DUF421 family)
MPPEGPKFLAAIAVRTLIVLLALVIGLRLLGKRQTGQFNIYDLSLIMLLANAVQNAMTNGDGHLLVGVVSAGTLLAAGWVVSRAFVRLPALGQRVIGVSTLLVNNGQFIKAHLQREHITQDQILAAMRQHGICELGQVRMAVLEIDGAISIVPTRASHHVTKKVAKRSRQH